MLMCLTNFIIFLILLTQFAFVYKLCSYSAQTFAKNVKSYQRGFIGEPDEVKSGRDEFNEYPSPCIWHKPFMYSTGKLQI